MLAVAFCNRFGTFCATKQAKGSLAEYDHRVVRSFVWAKLVPAEVP